MKKMTKAEQKAYDEIIEAIVQGTKDAEKMTDEEYEKDGEVLAIMIKRKDPGTAKKKARKRA